MKQIEFTQEELKQISKTYEMLYKRGILYPDDYYDYWCGWEFNDRFYVGSPEEGDEFVKNNRKAVWNFPIIKKSDYPNYILKTNPNQIKI